MHSSDSQNITQFEQSDKVVRLAESKKKTPATLRKRENADEKRGKKKRNYE